MISFQEFLHGDNWKKPLLPDLTKATAKIVRKGQQANDELRSTTTIPSHQKLMMALARAGTRGLTRVELGSLLDLDGQVLEDLLAALVRAAEISVSQRTDGQRVYFINGSRTAPGPNADQFASP